MRIVALIATALLLTPTQLDHPSAREAEKFLASLSPELRQKCVLADTPENRHDWHFVPKERNGVSWAMMNTNQRLAAHDLLKASLSQAGHQKIEQIRGLENVLKELENGNPGRNESAYFFTFFGQPSDGKQWAWRYEGHHISLTFAYKGRQMVSSTPQFLGTNPAEVQSGLQKGKRVLGSIEDLAFLFIRKLNPEQLKMAQISLTAPNDIVTGTSIRAAIEGRKGIEWKDLNSEQQDVLHDLIEEFADTQSEFERDRRIGEIHRHELSELVFAWMGSLERGKPHYFRIQGKALLIELDNTQNNANHIHSVWRNTNEDFGDDPLREHYANGHRHDHR